MRQSKWVHERVVKGVAHDTGGATEEAHGLAGEVVLAGEVEGVETRVGMAEGK